MIKRATTVEIDADTVFCEDIIQASKRYNLGLNLMRTTANDANAVIKIGKAYRINIKVMDTYMNSITGKAPTDEATT